MPRHDFSCPICAATVEVYRPVTERASDHPPAHCGVPMLWIPKVGFMDAREPFQRFSTEIRQPDGSYKTVEIDSLSKLRAVERSTEQAARNGEGEAMRFRMWSQNASNGDANSFGPDPSQPLDPAVKRRFGLQGGTIRSVDAPEVTLGPGVTEDSASVLGDS